MPALAASAVVWLFIMYVVVPIWEIITVIWPFVVGGVVLFAVAAIYQALRSNAPPPQNPDKAWSSHDSKRPAIPLNSGHKRQSAYLQNAGVARLTGPLTRQYDRDSDKNMANSSDQGSRISKEAAALIDALNGVKGRGKNSRSDSRAAVNSSANSPEQGSRISQEAAALIDYLNLTGIEPTTSSFAGNVPPGVPTRGLVIMEEPLNKILQGRKTMELRGKHNRQLGPIALIKKGSGKIYAVAEIAESVGPMSFDELRACSREHAVEPERLREVLENGWNHGWRLKNVVPLRSPVNYVHKGMSQVNLDPAAIEALRQQLASA